MNTSSSLWGISCISQPISQLYQLCSITTSKRIKLESPGWSGFVTNSKPDQTAFSKMRCLKNCAFKIRCTYMQFGDTHMLPLSIEVNFSVQIFMYWKKEKRTASVSGTQWPPNVVIECLLSCIQMIIQSMMPRAHYNYRIFLLIPGEQLPSMGNGQETELQEYRHCIAKGWRNNKRVSECFFVKV